MLSILCGNCHTLKSVGVPASLTFTAAQEQLEKLIGEEGLKRCTARVLAYEQGDISSELMYQITLHELLVDTGIAGLEDSPAWGIFSCFLALIMDPERQVRPYNPILTLTASLTVYVCHS
jgi:hypothetical protein